jgi:Putative transposase/GAF domain
MHLMRRSFRWTANFPDSPPTLVRHAGPIPQATALPLARGFVTGRVILDRRTIHLADVEAETDEYTEGSDSARRLGHHTILAVPLIHASEAIGVITMRRAKVRPFTERQIDLLTTFANQAVIAIENTRLFEEVQARNRELIETSEILRVISSSPTNTQPTFDAIAQSATRLCDAVNGIVLRYDGGLLHLAAHHNLVPERHEAVERVFPRPADRGSVAGRVVMSGAVAHVEDISTDPEYVLPRDNGRLSERTWSSDAARRRLHRCDNCGSRPSGAVFGQANRYQAVIAIENARLFEEVRARTRELTESLEYQTATSDVLGVINRSKFDLNSVLDTIARVASTLCGDDVTIQPAKEPFAGPEPVPRYMARYTHRVAISNRRLIAADEGGVACRWKDYRLDDPDRCKTMTLHPHEFIRRFLIHVLPKGFHRIRHYGLFANGNRADNIVRARVLLNVPLPVKEADQKGAADDTHVLPCPCPHCGGRMITIKTFVAGMQPTFWHVPGPIRIDTS